MEFNEEYIKIKKQINEIFGEDIYLEIYLSKDWVRMRIYVRDEPQDRSFYINMPIKTMKPVGFTSSSDERFEKGWPKVKEIVLEAGQLVKFKTLF